MQKKKKKHNIIKIDKDSKKYFQIGVEKKSLFKDWKKFSLQNKNATFCFCFRSFTAVGVDPAVMGVGPAVAIPAAVKSAGLELEDIDLFEINEVMGFYDACKFQIFMEFYLFKLSNFILCFV